MRRLATFGLAVLMGACVLAGTAMAQDENSENGGGSGGGGWNFDTPAETANAGAEVDPENLPVCAGGQTEGCLPRCEDGQTSNCITIGMPDVTELQEQGAECGTNGGAGGECSLR